MTYLDQEDLSIECTCFTIDQEHDNDCDLWSSPGFHAGTLVWSYRWGLVTPDDLERHDKTSDEMEFDWLNEMGWSSTDYDEDAKAVDAELDAARSFEELEDELSEATCTCSPENQATILTHEKPVFAPHEKACDLYECEPWVLQLCEWDPKAKELRYYWASDNRGETIPTRKLMPSDFLDQIAEALGKPTSSVPSTTPTTGYGKWMTDRHNAAEVTLLDGTVVYASSANQRKAGEPVPDYGLYLDRAWDPESIATFIPWRDYGLPEVRFDHVLATIAEHFVLAQRGWSVEVGCIGGHGRTGTVLACMAILAGTHPDDAVDYIRAHYCTHAVEADAQEWFVQWFGAAVLNQPAPPPPFEIFGTANPKPPPAPAKPVTPVKPAAPAEPAKIPEYAYRCKSCNNSCSGHSNFVCDNTKCAMYHVLASSPKGQRIIKRWGRK